MFRLFMLGRGAIIIIRNQRGEPLQSVSVSVIRQQHDSHSQWHDSKRNDKPHRMTCDWELKCGSLAGTAWRDDYRHFLRERARLRQEGQARLRDAHGQRACETAQALAELQVSCHALRMPALQPLSPPAPTHSPASLAISI